MYDPRPRSKEDVLSWDDYFMKLAFLSAQRSKDPNKQVGACVVSQANVILGIGYNGFPRGCDDDALPWAKKSQSNDVLETKYPYVCHAEVNAIVNANRASLKGQKIYVTLFPCNECTKLILQSGIAEVVYYEGKKGCRPADGRVFGENVPVNAQCAPCKLQPKAESAEAASFAASRRMLDLAGVKVRQHMPQDL